MARSLHYVASIYREQGKYAEADELDLRAVAIHEKTLSQADPDRAIDLRAMASLYCDQGKYAEAEPLYQRALATS